MTPAEQKLSTVVEHGISRPIEMAGYFWHTSKGEGRIRAPRRTRTGETIWATVEIVEPTTVVEP